jgi:hypothetical protein
MSTRTTSFPPSPRYGETHYEHGRTWKYVEPGIWKSAGGSGGGGSGPDGEVVWDDVLNKPTEFPPSAHNHDGDYLKAETDPTVPDHVKSITTEDIDNWNASGGASSWDELTGKPSEFPPAAHNQDWNTITNTPSEYPPESHAHDQSDVIGLELRLEQIEGSITDGGGFVDAPDDGKMYGRQSEAWAEVVIPDGGASSWDDLTDKPDTFPPSSHSHEISDVNGLGDALTEAGSDPAWDDITGKPDDFPPSAHGHAWGEITGKPTEFPPESHNHVVADITDFDPADYQPKGDYQPAGDYVTEASKDGKEYVRKNGDWVELVPTDGSSALDGKWNYSASGPATGRWTSRNPIWGSAVSITLNNEDATGYDHKFALVTEGDVLIVKAPAGGAEYIITSKTVNASDCVFEVDVRQFYGDFPSEGDPSEVIFVPEVNTGSNMHIGELPPDPALEGMQWLEVPADGDATAWIYDGSKWLQHPSGKDGKNGENGTNGVDGLWTDNGNASISYMDGNVGIGVESPSGVIDVTSSFDNNNSARFFNSSESGYGLLAKGGGADKNKYIADFRDKDNTTRLRIDGDGRVDIAGSLYVNGTPKIGYSELITTLVTLRNATKDETTLEGLRDSIGNAVGGLIEEFENQIATMPVPEPQVGTQEISE